MYSYLGKKKYFLQHLWRQFYDSLEQPDPKQGKDIIHHLQRAGTHTFLLRENIKSVQNLSTKLLRTVVRMSIKCMCVFVCVYSCTVLQSEYHNTYFTWNVTTFCGK